jgi:DNA-binding CsgD family transcriptional regulator
MFPHGHYCVPIISGNQVVLGVVTLYVKVGHSRDHREEDFLTAIADTLAGIVQLKKTQKKLKKRGKELEHKRHELEEVNTALRVLLKKRDEDKKVLEENLLFSIKHRVNPYLENLKNSGLNTRQQSYLDVLESNMEDIISPIARRLSSSHLNLSASEFQVANLIMDGKRTKEIALLLNLSEKTIEVHRKHIRRKLGLKNLRTNLRTHLLAFHNG